MPLLMYQQCSNNTNKLSPQEHEEAMQNNRNGSNNTNKLSPQEQFETKLDTSGRSNNTNKLSPQELHYFL